jgi:hypothetical protein
VEADLVSFDRDRSLPVLSGDVITAKQSGTYGIVTSAIVKTYPSLEVLNVALSFDGGSGTNTIDTF